jgi:putative peptidoglycan lipid II flippase
MILKNSAILAFFSIISLVLGIFRDRLLAQIVGVGPMLDVYNAAFKIPDLVYALLLSAVSAATVVPFITKASDAEEDDIPARFNSLFFFFGGALIMFSVAAAFLVPYVAKHVVPGFDEFQIKYFITMTRILLAQPFFLGLSALISSLAQVRHRFVLYSVAPLFYTIAIILSIRFLYPLYGIYGIAWGVIAGAFLSLLAQSYTLYESRMKLSWSLFAWKHIA